ncbi:MAG: bifunctional enoyl-CoA hydratase/phosphate acetyltransferase [Chloroflexia bacterium]|nr:bifunctional enoyl-CoA hydratase/phosphate acetyltransferase [Chloroflexia bacterium]
MAIRNFDELLIAAQKVGPKRVAIAGGAEHEVLMAAQEATKLGFAECVLVGDERGMREKAEKHNIDLQGLRLLHEKDDKGTIRRVVNLAGEGLVDVLMKGTVSTGKLLSAALSREARLRTGQLLSHVGAFEVPGYDRFIFITDGGVNIKPTVDQKLQIMINAVDVVHRLGVKEPRVALLAATELLSPHIPACLDALALSKMAEQGWIEGAQVDGPLALDTAVSPEAAKLAGAKGPVAGQADILVVPDVDTGNMVAKVITFFVRGRMAGIVTGAKVPFVISSRADLHEIKLVSMALGVMLAASA